MPSSGIYFPNRYPYQHLALGGYNVDKEKLKYLEIYPSEVAAKKILAHMDQMLKDKPKVYKKTIIRYKKLAELLIKILNKINQFIESETLLTSDETEFNELSKPLDDNVMPFEHISTSAEEFDGMHTSAQKYNTSVNIGKISTILQTGANIDFGYEEINQCARLVNMWFQSRIPKSASESDFRYNINQIPLWISHIIITYGRYFDLGKVYDLEQEFTYWCEEIKEDPHNTYRVPYCVYNTTRSDDTKEFSLSAVLIYDVLLEKCYYSLSDTMNIGGNDVISIVKIKNPGLSNAIRTRINHQDELLNTLGFTSTNKGGNK